MGQMRLTIVRAIFLGLIAVAFRVSFFTATQQQPLPLCEILENLRAYENKTVIVEGRNFNLTADCRSPQGPEDPRYHLPSRLLYNIDMRPDSAYQDGYAKAFQEYQRLWEQGYDVLATFTGRLEVMPAGGFGFGHLNSAAARIIVTRIDNIRTTGKKGPPRKMVPIDA
jgi:hypothetical protein